MWNILLSGFAAFVLSSFAGVDEGLDLGGRCPDLRRK